VRAYEFLHEGGLAFSTFDGQIPNGKRWTNFINRLSRTDGKNGMFELTPTAGGGTVQLDKADEIIDALEKSPPEWLLKPKKDGKFGVNPSAVFPINNTWKDRKTVDGKLDFNSFDYIALGNLQKTNDFGSTGSEAQVKDQTEKLDILNTILLKKLKEAGKKEIPVIIGDQKVNVAKFISTPKQCGGDCKADWTVVDANNQEVAWISHKKYKESNIGKKVGGKDYSHAGDFFGYGGMSDSLMKNVYDENKEIKDEINDFATSVKNKFPVEDGEIQLPLISYGNKGKTGLWIYRKITNGLIRAMSVYGVGFGKGNPRGLQNVDLILQGVPSFNNETPPRLVANGGYHSNGEKPDRLEGGYEPVLVAKYNPSRNQDIQGMKFMGVRFSIFPLAAVKQRKGEGEGTVQEI